MALPAMKTIKEELKQDDLLPSLTIPFFPWRDSFVYAEPSSSLIVSVSFLFAFLTSTTKKQH